MFFNAMPRSIRRTRDLLLALLLGLLPLVAATDPREPPANLRVGVSQTPGPLAASIDGVLRGLEIDLARALTETLGRELTISLLPEARLVEALKGGRIDLMLTSMPIEEIHALRLAASQPLLRTGPTALIRAADLKRFDGPLAILSAGGPVGFQRGSSAARFVHDHMPFAERRPFADSDAAIAALRAGKIELLILDALRAWPLAADPAERELVVLMQPLGEEHIVWAVREIEGALLQSIDAIIARWRDSGFLETLIARWISVRIRVE